MKILKLGDRVRIKDSIFTELNGICGTVCRIDFQFISVGVDNSWNIMKFNRSELMLLDNETGKEYAVEVIDPMKIWMKINE